MTARPGPDEQYPDGTLLRAGDDLRTALRGVREAVSAARWRLGIALAGVEGGVVTPWYHDGMTAMTFRLDAELDERLRTAAFQDRRTKQSILDEAVREWLNRRERAESATRLLTAAGDEVNR